MLLGLLTTATLSSCCSPAVEYVDRPYEVLVEVPCQVHDVKCDVNGTDGEVVLGLVKCVIDLKMEAKKCY